MEVLSSRVLLRPSDLERSVHFYEETLGLAVYREWGEGRSRSVVFFLGGGLGPLRDGRPRPGRARARLRRGSTGAPAAAQGLAFAAADELGGSEDVARQGPLELGSAS